MEERTNRGFLLAVSFGGSDGGYDDGENLVGFLKKKGLETRFGRDLSADDQLQPENHFISLFFDDAKLLDEVVAALGTAGCPVIRSDRCPSPADLARHVSSFLCGGQRIHDLEDSKRENQGAL